MTEHYALHSRLLPGDDSNTEAQKAAFDPAFWPVVRTNPRTWRNHLFIGVHARAIEGLTATEADGALVVPPDPSLGRRAWIFEQA